MKLKKGGGHAGHNGLRDIIAHLGSSDFYRLRIGIDRPGLSHQVSNYVLSEPNKIENEQIYATFRAVSFCISDMVLGDILKAMNELNIKT